MKPMRTRQLLYATTALTSALGLSASFVGVATANPIDGNVVSGSATISAPNPSTVQIDQSSQNAIINWRSFNIEAGETTRFVQPSSSSWTLNRVTGEMEPTRILGTLEANGNVAIVNPDGILFGEGSRVDVNGLIATTHDIANDDFMAGRFNFTRPGNSSASVVNEGQISIGDYGIGAFVAPGVRNSGVITAKLGSISLASGNGFTLDLYGDNLIHLLVGDEITQEVIDVATGEPVADLVKNEGRISADGGTVALKAATARRAVNSVINNTGVIEANSVGVRNGKIILGAQTAGTKTVGAPVQRVKVSGTLSATNVPLPTTEVPLPTWRPDSDGTGGTIEITGEMIEVAGADIDASGANGGGTVVIGGDYLGGRASDERMAELGIEREAQAIPTASYVSLDAETTISADAHVDGDGGKVVVWSDVATATAAKITARGGAEGGDGGFIETSGKYLDVRAVADASAAKGTAGTWLLDPYDMHIRDVASSSNIDDYFTELLPNGLTGTRVFPTGTPSVVDTDVIEAALNAGTNIQISNREIDEGAEAGHIYVEDDISKTAGGDATLNLVSANNIYFSDGVSITSSAGELDLLLYATSGAIHGESFGTLDLNGGVLGISNRDGIDFHTASTMPNIGLSIRPFEDSPLSTINYSMSFGADTINFSGTNTTTEFNTDSIKLVNPNAFSTIEIELYSGDIGIADNAILATNDRNVGLLLYHEPNFYYLGDAEANGVPEIVSNGRVRVQYIPGPAPFVPTVEVNAVDPPNCVGITCVQVALAQPLPEVPQSVLNPGNNIYNQQMASAINALNTNLQSNSPLLDNYEYWKDIAAQLSEPFTILVEGPKFWDTVLSMGKAIVFDSLPKAVTGPIGHGSTAYDTANKVVDITIALDGFVKDLSVRNAQVLEYAKSICGVSSCSKEQVDEAVDVLVLTPGFGVDQISDLFAISGLDQNQRDERIKIFFTTYMASEGYSIE